MPLAFTEVTVYCVTGAPFANDADHVTKALVSLEDATLEMMGALGAVSVGTTELDGTDTGLVPNPFVAVTLKL